MTGEPPLNRPERWAATGAVAALTVDIVVQIVLVLHGWSIIPLLILEFAVFWVVPDAIRLLRIRPEQDGD